MAEESMLCYVDLLFMAFVTGCFSAIIMAIMLKIYEKELKF
jgi:hypothetical protein